MKKTPLSSRVFLFSESERKSVHDVAISFGWKNTSAKDQSKSFAAAKAGAYYEADYKNRKYTHDDHPGNVLHHNGLTDKWKVGRKGTVGASGMGGGELNDYLARIHKK